MVMPGEASVWAWMIPIGTPNVSSTRRTSAGGTVAPPESATRTDDVFVVAIAGWSRVAGSIVGTPPNRMLRSSSISRRWRAGSNHGCSTWVAHVPIADRVASTDPAVWNIGMTLTIGSPGRMPRSSP